MMLRKTILAMTAAAAVTACGGGSETGTPSQGAEKRLAVAQFAPIVASFAGPRNNYRLARTSTGYSVTNAATGVSSSVTGTDSIRFDDVTVNLGIGDKSKTLSSIELRTLIDLYVAFFNRVPDADGLSYWIDQFKAGQTIVQISESFYAAAIQFSSLTGYSVTMTNDEFVRVIYKNVLGRSGATAPPDADVQYWSGELAAGRATKGSLISTMLDSARSFAGDPTWGWVPALLDNKNTVARYFAVQHGLNFNTSEASITNTMAIAAAVTPESTTAAISQINMADSSFSLLNPAPAPSVPTTAQVLAITTQRCFLCHNVPNPPAGIRVDTEAVLRTNAARIYQQVVVLQRMPLGNATQMTAAERAIVAAWFEGGTP
ncbi:DUF4214 domain-containing protein [Noviherbaspirillum denitrificans]|uniref:DUF4214 domain-containing protein n=1 Tax=Noviherbaspirillum denitrificans TaxID=1968433 RepID=A0A254TFK8_9BURK|nr:DUF4214 domain-containing protein [Noviherbaspirillum denitrificans]OWW21394.1 hypothetical protein AYR66_19820 [Noviherbaspirillum denitrificans]